MRLLRRNKIRLVRWWQKLEVGEPPASFGKGKFVDMQKLRGGRIKLVSYESTPRRPKGALILTPYWANHGFLVKFIDENGHSPWTSNLSFDDIYQLLARNKERLGGEDE